MKLVARTALGILSSSLFVVALSRIPDTPVGAQSPVLAPSTSPVAPSATTPSSANSGPPNGPASPVPVRTVFVPLAVMPDDPQKLIDAAAPGTTVTLARGIYNTPLLRLKSGVSLAGAGMLQTIVNCQVILSGVDGVTVSKLTFASNTPSYLVQCQAPSGTVNFTDVRFDQKDGAPPLLRQIKKATFLSCFFDGSKSSAGAPSFDGSGLYMKGCAFRHASGRVTFRFTTGAQVIACKDFWNNQPLNGKYTEVGGPDISWSAGLLLQACRFVGIGPVDTAHNSGEALVSQYWPLPSFRRQYHYFADWPDSPVISGLRVQDCTFANSHYPIELYDGGMNCSFIHNTLNDVPGFSLRGDFQNGRSLPIVGCVVRGNQLNTTFGPIVSMPPMATGASRPGQGMPRAGFSAGMKTPPPTVRIWEDGGQGNAGNVSDTNTVNGKPL